MNIQPIDKKAEPETQRGLARIAYAFTEWAEKWVPDAFVFVILTT
jgi:short-chain fatty acids transporter